MAAGDFFWADHLLPGETYQEMVARLDAAGTLDEYRERHRAAQLQLLATNDEYRDRQRAANRARALAVAKSPNDAQRAARAAARRRYHERLKADPERWAARQAQNREIKARARAARKDTES